MVKTSDD